MKRMAKGRYRARIHRKSFIVTLRRQQLALQDEEKEVDQLM